MKINSEIDIHLSHKRLEQIESRKEELRTDIHRIWMSLVRKEITPDESARQMSVIHEELTQLNSESEQITSALFGRSDLD